jgi:hypothetical protein
VVAASVVASIAAFLGLTWVTMMLRGREVIVNYHHLLAVSVVAAAIPWAAGVSVVEHVAAFVVALMVLQGFGRLGCLSAGCCHGRPARWGIQYAERHAASGFPPPFVGVPMLPIQAVESVWAFAVAAAGAVMLMHDVPSGEVLMGVTASYALGRLGAEFFRGDADRVMLAALSEAQWISLSVLCVTAGAGWLTNAESRLLLLAVAALTVAGTMAWLLVRRRKPPLELQLLDAAHILELAAAVAFAGVDTNFRDGGCGREHIHLATTSLGITVSAGLAHPDRGSTHHYTISATSDDLTERTASRLAAVILLLRHPRDSGMLVVGRRRGTFHLLVAAP